MEPLPDAFFTGDTLEVARSLIGKRLVHRTAEGTLEGVIVETEAYTHDDPAFRGWGIFDAEAGLVKSTGRGRDLYGPPGLAYIYLIYRRYWMLNVVTRPKGEAGAVLLRAVRPARGLDAMQGRRPAAKRPRDLCNGPGKLSQAFDVDRRFHGDPLTAPPLFLAEPDPEAAPPGPIATSSRIGLSFGVDRPYRFFVEGSPYVSPGVPSDIAAARRAKR